MKLLMIMRHAKSSKDNPELKDFDRPLNERGLEDAPRMGELLKKKKLVPDLIISSLALRAKSTAELVAQACAYPGEIQWNEEFYDASPSQYVKGLKALPDLIQKVMIIGHNPGMESLLNELTGERHNLPTAAIACLGLSIDRWKELTLQTKATLQHLWEPKEI